MTYVSSGCSKLHCSALHRMRRHRVHIHDHTANVTQDNLVFKTSGHYTTCGYTTYVSYISKGAAASCVE